MIKNIANGIEHSNKQPSITAAKPPITNKITIIILSIIQTPYILLIIRNFINNMASIIIITINHNPPVAIVNNTSNKSLKNVDFFIINLSLFFIPIFLITINIITSSI